MIDTMIGSRFLNGLLDATFKDKIDWEFIESENGFAANIAGDTIEITKSSNKGYIIKVNDIELHELSDFKCVEYLYNELVINKTTKESVLGSIQNIYKELTGKDLFN
jgi:hypothetical protein